MFSRYLQKAFNYFLFLSLYIALCAVAMTFQTTWLFGLHHYFLLYGFVFCGTVCSYNTHWAFTPKLFENPITSRNGLDEIPVWLHIVLAIGAIIGAFVFFLLLRQHWIWLAGAAVLSGFYTAPKIPLRITRWLQQVAFGKTIFLTLAWTYITAILPLLLADTPLTAPHILFCVNRFYLIYAICIIFDLRDREDDKKEGIKSMITNCSLPAVDRLYWGSLIVYFATALLLLFYFPVSFVLAFSIPGAILAFGYGWFKRQRSEIVYNFILDGLMIFSLPLLLLFGI